MKPKQINIILSATLFVLVASSFGVVWAASHWLSLRPKATIDLKLEILALQNTQKNGIKSGNELEKYKDDIKHVDQAIPSAKEQADIVKQLIKIADESNISIGTISFPTSELGNAAAKPAAPTTSDDTSKTTTSTSPTSIAPTPTPAPAAAPSITQAKPVEGLTGLYKIQILASAFTDRASGKIITYDQMISLLNSLENNLRIFQMTNVSIVPSPSEDGTTRYSLSLQLNTYIKQ